MNRRLRLLPALNLKNLTALGTIAFGLALLIHTGGCASGRPAALLLEHPLQTVPTTGVTDPIRFRVVTYNIWGLPSWMNGAASDRYPKIARELERLSPDFILLQEAWTANARKAAPTNGSWCIARADGQKTFFQQSGLVTLSRFPIIGGQFYPFSRAAFPDSFVNKGVLKVTVQLPRGRKLNVWNVHLQDGGSLPIRLSQIRELVSRVNASDDGQIADLVGGDFNCEPDSLLHRQLVNSLGPGLQQLGGTNTFVTWDGLSDAPGAGQTLDYLFVRERAAFQNTQAAERVAFVAPNLHERLSDHFGIEAVVSLSPGVSWAQLIDPQEGAQLQTRAAAWLATLAGRQ